MSVRWRVTGPLLLAWRPRGEHLDPPAGQSGCPLPTSPTTVPEDDD